MADEDASAKRSLTAQSKDADPVAPPQSYPARPVQVISASQQSLTYNSPIPPPEILAGYNAIVASDAGDRILKMVEAQEAHRISIESRVIAGDNARATLAPILGTIIVLSTLLTTVYLVKLGQGAWGIAAVLAEVAVIAGMFVYGTKNRSKERAERLAQQYRSLEAQDKAQKLGQALPQKQQGRRKG